MIDKRRMTIHFNKSALTYEQYAHIQKKMKDYLMNFLIHTSKNTNTVKNILEIGCGTGYLTNSLINFFPSAHITAVDISPEMIANIKLKFSSNSVNFICADIEDIKLDKTYDLIISNATFQWFNDSSSTIKKLFTALKPNGTICFSTFGNYTFHELNGCFEKTRKSMCIKEPIYSGQNFYSLNELIDLCREATQNDKSDFNILLESKEKYEYEYFSNCKDFLYSIKKVGANKSNKNEHIISPAFIKKVIEIYDKDFMINNKVKATYHCLFFKIQKQLTL